MQCKPTLSVAAFGSIQVYNHRYTNTFRGSLQGPRRKLSKILLFYPLASLILCDVPLYFYRSNPASITGQSFSEKRLDIFPILDERVQYYDAHHDNELALKTLVMAFYITGYYYTTFWGETLTPKLAALLKKYYLTLMHRKPSLKAIWDYTSNYISSRFSVFFAAKKR